MRLSREVDLELQYSVLSNYSLPRSFRSERRYGPPYLGQLGEFSTSYYQTCVLYSLSPINMRSVYSISLLLPILS
jgi:hypothetical protein